MNTHYNARLTAWGRAELVRRVLVDEEPPSVVAAALLVTRQTVAKWVRRFVEEGWAGLVDRSSRPRRSPRATPSRLVQQIVRLRRQRLTGPEIAERLRVAPSTVGRVLQRLGMGRLKQPGSTGGPAYQRTVPGELLHLDTKALPRFRAIGHRIHGNRSKAGRARGLGHDHLHVAIDDATGIALIALAVVLFIIDVFAPSHGILTGGGIVAFFLGALMLFDRADPAFRLSLGYIIPGVLLTAAFFMFVVGKGLRAQSLPVRVGRETMIGQVVPALASISAAGGKVFIEGELWNAVSDEPVDKDAPVEVVAVEGLTLKVKRKV